MLKRAPRTRRIWEDEASEKLKQIECTALSELSKRFRRDFERIGRHSRGAEKVTNFQNRAACTWESGAKPGKVCGMRSAFLIARSPPNRMKTFDKPFKLFHRTPVWKRRQCVSRNLSESLGGDYSGSVLIDLSFRLASYSVCMGLHRFSSFSMLCLCSSLFTRFITSQSSSATANWWPHFLLGPEVHTKNVGALRWTLFIRMSILLTLFILFSGKSSWKTLHSKELS